MAVQRTRRTSDRMARREALRRLLIGASGVGLLAAIGCQSKSDSTSSSSTAAPGGTSAAGAAAGTAAGAPKRGGTLVFAQGGDISGLDPQNDRGATNTLAEQEMFDTFYRFVSGETTIEPALAERHEVAPDGLTYTFFLRPNLKFHDGTPLDAQAYKFALDRQAYEDNPYHKGGSFASWTSFFGGGYPGDVETMTAVDARTFQFKLKKPVVNAMYAFADMTTVAISPEVIKKDPANWGKKPLGAGAGAFMFEEWAPNQRLTYRRFPDYWETGKPYLDRLIFRVIPDTAARLLALKTGEVQVIPIQGDEVRDLLKDPSVTVLKGPPGPMTYIGFDHQDPIMRKREVRQAISQALNREQLVKQLWPETAIPAQNHGLFPGMLGYREDLKWYPYDVQKAKQLLSDAGYPNGLDLTMTFNKETGYAPDVTALAETIQGELAKAGIRVKLTQVDRTTLFSTSRADPKTGKFPYQLVLNAAGNRGDSQSLMRVWNTWTNYGFEQKAFGELLDRASIEPDDKKRQALWGQMQQKIYDDAGFVPLSHSQSTLAARKDVNGLKAPFSEWPIYFANAWLS